MFSDNDNENVRLQFKMSRNLMGILTLAFVVFLYGEYLRFLMDTNFSVVFRLVVFLIGQLVCFILLSWSGVLLSKQITCPECREGRLIFPLADLYSWIPSLPFSPKFLINFSFNSKDGYILNSEEDQLKGHCQCCGATFRLENQTLVVTKSGKVRNSIVSL